MAIDYQNPDWLCIHKVVNHQCKKCFPSAMSASRSLRNVEAMLEASCPNGAIGPYSQAAVDFLEALAPIREQLEGLVREWRSGIHAERLRERYNSHSGDYLCAASALDELLECADQLEALVGAVGKATK